MATTVYPTRKATCGMHHCYFDPDKLTDEQRARWDWAIAEYNKILNGNVERQISRMSAQDKENLLHSFPMFRVSGESLDEDARKVLRLFHGLSGGAEGDPRSALFARLLTGKQPLSWPPPSTFHHPWYEVIEGNGPFEVMLSDAHTQAPSPEHGELAPLYSLCIDHCPWLVDSTNDAAHRLFVLQERLNAKERRESDGTCFDWTPELLDEVRRALQESPEFLVRFEEWPLYRLRLNVRESSGERSAIPVEPTPESLLRINNVFDTHTLRVGYHLLGEPADAGAELRYAWQGWLLEKRL